MKKFITAFCTILMAAVSFAEDVTEETLRFVPGIWATDNAKFAAWVWGDNVEGAWTPFFTGEGDTLSTTINAQAESIIFVRLSSSATEPSWDENTMWNKTGDLTIDHQSFLYVITDWESGEWVTAPGNYYLIGNAEQLGSWNTKNALPIENGTISLELPAGKYAFQVLPEDKSWNTALKYGAVNTRCSSLGLKTDADENIWFTLEETATIAITIVNEKICISGAIKDFSDEVYSNYAIIVNHERIYGCAYAGNSSNWPQYSARVQLNVDDTIRIIDRMTSNYEMQVPSDEYGENDKFETYMYGEYRVCKVAGCYDIYYKTNGYLYITSTDNCSQGVEYDRLYIPYANVNITVTNEYENAQGYVEVNGTGIGNSGGVSASYVMGSHLTLQAYPNENFQFLQWSDGALENPRNLIVTGDTTIHADMGNLAYYPTGILLNHNRFIRSTYNDGTQLIVRANIQQGDKVELYFINDNIYWMAEVEPYGLYENFSGSAEQGYLICNVSGCYDIYFKMVDGITQSIYIGQGTVCNDGVPWTDPNTGYVYSVVGTENLFGTAWDIADTLTNMTPVGDGRFEYTLDSVTLTPEGDYQYKVIANHMWNVREYPSVEEDDNYHITVEESGVYSVLFSLDTIAGCSATTNYLHAITGNSAHIWNISPSSPSEGDNLRIALSTAENGDTIVMAAGTYVESSNDYISFNGKHVIVKAEDGADVIIQPQTPIIIKEGGCAHFENIKFDVSRLTEQSSWFEHLMYPNDDNEGNSIILEGCEFYDFTLNSSLLYCATAKRLASLSINNCYFHNITKSCLYIENTDETNVLISNSTFANITTETSSYYAGVIDTRATAGTFSIDHCTFYNVQAMNTDYAAIGKVKIPDATVSNCIFAMPESTSSLRAIRDVTTANNCLIFSYTNDSGYGIHSEVIINNCIKEQDPLFADAANGDFTLESGSPAIGAATDGSNLGDPRWGTNENIPSTDFSVPYIFVGETATLSGNIQLNDLGHIAYADSKDNGIASWKINVTRECNVKVTITMETGSSSGHQFVVDILDEHQEIIAELTQPSAQYGDAAIELPDSIAFITPGVYTIRLSNLTEWSAAIVEGVLFTAITSGSDLCTIASGSCGANGDNLTWVLGCDSVLTISGEGEMPTSYSGTSAPWYEHGAAIKHINIEEGVTKLALNAFYNAGNNYPNVRTLSIPSTLGAPIENNFFYQCPLKTITINSDTIVGKASYSSGSSLQNKFGAQVEEYIFGGNVRSIANFAFYNQSPDSLCSIILPEGLETIGNWAFGYIEHLTSISIPSTVQTIGTEAFAYCTNLRSIELGEGLTNIDGQAFWMCDNLTNVTSHSLNPPSLNSTAFDHYDTLYVPCEAKDNYKQADYWQNFNLILCPDDTIGGYTEPDVPEQLTFTLSSSWQFIMLPTVFGLLQDDIIVDGDIAWAVYDSQWRAEGRSGWKAFDPVDDGFSASRTYIVRARNSSATLTIRIPDQAREKAGAAIPFAYNESSHPENANWNFLGNPYPFSFNITSALDSQGIESPIAVWNGIGYDMFTPGIDQKILSPFEAFFIQMPDHGAEVIQFVPDYIDDSSSTNTGNNSVADADGALPGYFTINTSKQKVQFSRGNLQYQASTATWQFAENQYEVVGDGNANISSTYDGWIDLFGWGTGNNPTKTSTSKCDYSSFVDWGINAISNGGNTENMWRTLSANEWTYITGQRTNCDSLCGRATVCGIKGFILLPDDWVSPGVPFKGSENQGYELNQYSLEDWQKMEAAGAVFLPECGSRTGTEFSIGGVQYWSTNDGTSCYAYDIITAGASDYKLKTNQIGRHGGYGVRLVK